ncbi:15239_t:CDS:1, partial [Gigaspora margarita]
DWMVVQHKIAVEQVGKIKWVEKIGWVVKYKIAVEQVGLMIEIVE